MKKNKVGTELRGNRGVVLNRMVKESFCDEGTLREMSIEAKGDNKHKILRRECSWHVQGIM